MSETVILCKKAASPSRLPGLDWAINPYKGCAHGCLYCYAQDVTRFRTDVKWGTVIEVKANIARALKAELQSGARGVYGVGTVTDPYQPSERKHELTRACIRVLREANARFSILTKSDLVLRDIDLLKNFDKAEVGISIGIIDEELAAKLEPDAPSPQRRFEALRELTSSGVRTYLMAAPFVSGTHGPEKDLQSLVRQAEATSVRTLMWDTLNPKPIMLKRMRNELPEFAERMKSFPNEIPQVRSVLSRECRLAGIELLDAF